MTGAPPSGSVNQVLRKRAIQQAYVAKLGMRGLLEINLSVFMEDVLKSLVGTIGSDFGSILESVQDHNIILLKSGIGWKKGTVGRAVFGGGKESHAGFVLQTRAPVIVEDFSKEDRFKDEILTQNHGINSGIAVVINGPQGPFGVLAAYNKKPRKYSEDDVEFIHSVANILGAAIERKRSEHAILESNELFRAVFNQAAVGIAQFGLQSYFEIVNSKFCQVVGYAEEELVGLRLEDLVDPADQEAAAEAFKSVVEGRRNDCSIEVRLKKRDGSTIWTQITLSGLHTTAGHAKAALGIVQDISLRKRSEELKEVLAAELDHRVKNTLTTVLSMAKQSMARTESYQSFRKSFESRLLAMADIHTLLNRNRWQGAALKDIVRRVTAPYEDQKEQRIVISGQDVPLYPQEAQSLYLVLYELTANAAKYGALSVPQGKLNISWNRGEGGAEVKLVWQESNGPQVPGEIKKGFGSTLIERSVSYELGGRVNLVFDPAGVRCEIVFPLRKQPEFTLGDKNE